MLWLVVTTTSGIVLKGHNVSKVENRCSKGRTNRKWLAAPQNLVTLVCVYL